MLTTSTQTATTPAFEVHWPIEPHLILLPLVPLVVAVILLRLAPPTLTELVGMATERLTGDRPIRHRTTRRRR